jgi:predicted anti-sigma-YlaC factor YlaD
MMMSHPDSPQQEFQRWLATLDEDVRRDIPDDLLELSDEELADCESCRRFLDDYRRTVEMCRHAPRPCLGGDQVRRAADRARAELRRRGLIPPERSS